MRTYGGLPLTTAARAAARSKLLQDGDQTLQVAYASLKGTSAKPIAHVSDVDAVRVIADENQLAWTDKEPSRQHWTRRSGAAMRCSTPSRP